MHFLRLLCFVAVLGLGCLHLQAANYVWPISGTNVADEMNTSFGPRLNRAQWDFHDGIDLPAAIGTPLRAVRAGTVHRAGDGGQNGFSSRHVVLLVNDPAEGPIYVVYLHLDSIAAGITNGVSVAQGQVIGNLGIDGASHAHLHIEFRRGALQEINSVHPLGYLNYSNTVNFTAPSNVVVTLLGGQRAARVHFDGLSRLEGDLRRVEVELRAGTNVLETRVVDFNLKSTVNGAIGDAFVYRNEIGVEGYQAPDMKSEGRQDLKQGILVRRLPSGCDQLIARVIDVGSNVVSSGSLAIPARALFEASENFENGAMPPAGWSSVVSSGLSLVNSAAPGAAYQGSRGLVATDTDLTDTTQQRACIEIALPTGASNRFEWVAEAWFNPQQMTMPDGDFLYLLSFMNGTRTVAAARIRNESGILTAGVIARNPDFSCGSQDCFNGAVGTFTGPWTNVWRKWRLHVSRLNTREATAALWIDDQETARVTFDNTTNEVNRLRAGLALTDRSVAATVNFDEVRVSENTLAEITGTQLQRQGGGYRLLWSGGLPPFQVQMRSNWNGSWTNLATGVSIRLLDFTNPAGAGNYRIIGP